MIKNIIIKNFMGHDKIDATDIASINVLIGKNDTGKTGLLKLLYSVAKSLEVYSAKRTSGELSFKREIAEKLFNTFQPRRVGLGELVTKGIGEKLSMEVIFSVPSFKGYKEKIHFLFGDRTENTITDCTENVETISSDFHNSLFIPAKEVLTAFGAIRATREKLYMPGFDDTYLDLIQSLSISTTKGRVADELSGVNRKLEELFEGTIEQTSEIEQPFVFKRGNQLFSMQLTAEGIKKIGILSTLIKNRQLGKGTILFMDEPETALHPNAVRSMVEMLVAMSNSGVQIFVATHSYFVIKQLSIISRKEKRDIHCWSLEKTGSGRVKMTKTNLKDQVLESSIIREAIEMFNEDTRVELGL